MCCHLAPPPPPPTHPLTVSGLHLLRRTVLFWRRGHTNLEDLVWTQTPEELRLLTKYPFCARAESGGAPLHLATAVVSSGPAEDTPRFGFGAEVTQMEAAGTPLCRLQLLNLHSLPDEFHFLLHYFFCLQLFTSQHLCFILLPPIPPPTTYHLQSFDESFL